MSYQLCYNFTGSANKEKTEEEHFLFNFKLN